MSRSSRRPLPPSRDGGDTAAVRCRVRHRLRRPQHRRQPRALRSDLPTRLFALGVLLALYDGAEVLLKPVFGSLADRIGPRPVLLGGLLGFAAASAAFVLAGNAAGLGLARFAQGAAAAAFSPAAGAMIARIAPDRRRGRAFGSYGAWKGLGYTLGPGPRRHADQPRRLPAAVHRPHRSRTRGDRLGDPRRPDPVPTPPHPSDPARPRPAPQRPRIPAADHRPGAPAPPPWPAASASSPSSAPAPGWARSPPERPSRSSPPSPP